MHLKFILVEDNEPAWFIFASFNWIKPSFWLKCEIAAISSNPLLFKALTDRVDYLEFCEIVIEGRDIANTALTFIIRGRKTSLRIEQEKYHYPVSPVYVSMTEKSAAVESRTEKLHIEESCTCTG
jgi:hypothetical protein